MAVAPSPKTAELEPHNINLIDTPGHADFTFEVLRSLRILDGAVCILDGVAGVEAQTEKVWHQAAQYAIPKIIYVNKLDRDGAAFGVTVRQVASRLHTWPAVCQIPWWKGGKGDFCGVGDAVGLRAIRWVEGGDGREFEILSLEDAEEEFAGEIRKARAALVELLGERDEGMVERYLEAEEDAMAISEADVIASLRRCVLDKDSNITPVFAGASFRNIGVQPLLDAVVQLLPSPEEAPDPEVKLDERTGTLSELLSGKLMLVNDQKSNKALARHKKPSTALIHNLEACALAFKVVYDARRGMLVYVRVYSGSLHRQSLLFNTNLQLSERAPQLLKMYASDSIQIDSIPAGQIGVIPGLKHTRTGDTLITYTGSSPKTGPPSPLNTLQLRPIDVPPAVFFSSIEPHSLSDEKAVHTALDLLVREDPSLQVRQDEESGQTLLSGMGEFHLEIAQDRLVNELKAKASMGAIEIAYRETILQPNPPDIHVFEREQGGKQGRASCTAQVAPLSSYSSSDEQSTATTNNDDTITHHHIDGNLITIHLPSPSSTATFHSSSDPETLLTPLLNGALSALSRGINHNIPLHNTHVTLTLTQQSPSTSTTTTTTSPENSSSTTTTTALASTARSATKAALQATSTTRGTALLELVMRVIVSGVDEGSLGAVVNDLSSTRGGTIVSLDDDSSSSTTTASHSSSSSTLTTVDSVERIDVNRVYIPPDPFAPSAMATDGQSGNSQHNRHRTITAIMPLKEMLGYLKHLRSMTGGRGTFVMGVEGWESVVGQREKRLVGELRGW